MRSRASCWRTVVGVFAAMVVLSGCGDDPESGTLGVPPDGLEGVSVAAARAPDVCSLGRHVIVSGNTGGKSLTLRARVGDVLWENPDPIITEGDITNAPRGRRTTLTANYQGREVGQATVNDLCSGEPISLSVTVPDFTTATLVVVVTDSCSGSSNPWPLAGTTVIHSAAGITSFVRSTGANGSVSEVFPAGTRVRIDVVHPQGRARHTATITVNEGTAPYEVRFDTCITGSAGGG